MSGQLDTCSVHCALLLGMMECDLVLTWMALTQAHDHIPLAPFSNKGVNGQLLLCTEMSRQARVVMYRRCS